MTAPTIHSKCRGTRLGGKPHPNAPEGDAFNLSYRAISVLAQVPYIKPTLSRRSSDHQFRVVFDQRSFKVASPIRAKINEMIQKRITICGSCQPFFSKWWWIGAIRNTRRPVLLK